jgi:hypothetical protein
MAPAAVAAISALASVYSITEQRSARKDAQGARRRTEARLAQAEKNRVKALQESSFAQKQKRRERATGGFSSTQGASLLGGNTQLLS